MGLFSEPQIEQAVELGDGLIVHVVSHRYPGLEIALWSLISEGMATHGQREIVFSVVRRRNERIEDVPAQLLVLLRQIHQLARQGQRVDWGGMTELGEDLLAPDHRGVVYADALPIAGVRIPDNALTAIVIDRDELAVVKRFGLHRVLARIGKQHGHFPYSPWTDRDRKRVAYADDDKSLLRMFGAKLSFAPASLALEGKRVALQLLRRDGAELVSWTRCKQALADGQPFTLPPSTVSDLAFELCWIEQALRSPVDGELRHADGGWHTYLPDSGKRMPGAGELTLLSSERELHAAIAVDQLAGYIKQIYSVVGALAPTSIARTRLTLHIELAPDAAPALQLVAEPALAAADNIREAVIELAPQVTGPLAFEVTIKLGSDA